MPLAAVEVARIVEGAVGVVLVLVVVVIAAMEFVRWRRDRRIDAVEPGEPGLSRFADTESTDAASFGGGAWSARVQARRDTVTYGYLAVAEEYVSDDTGGRWCTLTVTLPGKVPFVVVDNRTAAGRSGVPMEAPYRGTVDDPPFDATYVVGGEEASVVSRVLSPEARDVLLRAPVQRLMLCESQLMLRTFDGVRLDEAQIAGLDSAAARFLAATPSFVTAVRAGSVADLPVSQDPLPPGFYGPDDE